MSRGEIEIRTVGELIEFLETCSPDAPVRIWDEDETLTEIECVYEDGDGTIIIE